MRKTHPVRPAQAVLSKQVCAAGSALVGLNETSSPDANRLFDHVDIGWMTRFSSCTWHGTEGAHCGDFGMGAALGIRSEAEMVRTCASPNLKAKLAGASAPRRLTDVAAGDLWRTEWEGA